jgi:hypothetical protein
MKTATPDTTLRHIEAGLSIAVAKATYASLRLLGILGDLKPTGATLETLEGYLARIDDAGTALERAHAELVSLMAFLAEGEKGFSRRL